MNNHVKDYDNDLRKAIEMYMVVNGSKNLKISARIRYDAPEKSVEIEVKLGKEIIDPKENSKW